MTPFQATQEASGRTMWLVVDEPGQPVDIEQVRFKRAARGGLEADLLDGRRVPSARIHRSIQAARLEAGEAIRRNLASLVPASADDAILPRDQEIV